MQRRKLIEKIASLEWIHTIDLGNGVLTPGKWPANPHILEAMDGINFEGKKVLDVGTCNGLWTFEAEKRGAIHVSSIDYLTHVGYWCTPAFKLAHRVLKSRAIYNPDLSVYDVENLAIYDFDVIIFCGVYYHLKNPLLAFAKLRKILRSGGTLIIEGPVIQDDKRCYAKFLYKDADPDRSNWWIPTSRCLREWIECSFFEITKEKQTPDPEYTGTISYSIKSLVKRVLDLDATFEKRTVIVAQGAERNDTLYSVPDNDLIGFYKK